MIRTFSPTRIRFGFRICGFLAAGCSRVCVFHKNIPSMLSQVTKLLSDKGVNIENMQSKSRKDVAYTVLDCAGQVGQDALESLVDSEGIIRIRVISA